jgi:hypothetical protein
MKKLILAILILSAASVKSQTNMYHPFPDSSAFWNVRYSWYYGSDSHQEYYSITFSGDTIINSTAYHQLIVPGIQSFHSSGPWGNSSFWDSAGYYAGSIRQDTAIRKVFFVPPNDSIEWLLYDFNMEVGDTLKGYLVDSSSVTYIVQQVDSYFVDNSYRKTWGYYGNSFFLIEGIGSMGGLIERFIDMDPVASETYNVQCFVQNDSTVFPESGSSCEMITSVYEKNTQQFSIAISPNPLSIDAKVQLSPQFFNSEMFIYNQLGVLVYHEKIIQESIHHFNRKNLASGIYFMQFINKKAEAATLKFVIE